MIAAPSVQSSLPARAEPAAHRGKTVAAAQAANSNCVSAALAAKVESWTCFGGVLTTTRLTADGRTRIESKAVAGDKEEFTDVSDAEARSASLSAVVDRVRPNSNDDYDSWCENGSVCGRKMSKYIAEVKGNGAYGDQNGVIGAVDIIQRQAFNGRWPRWRGLIIWDGGPAIWPSYYRIDCKVSIPLWPDGNCGWTTMQFSGISSGKWRSWFPSEYTYTSNNERLVGSTKYYENMYGAFTVTGHPQTFYFGTLRTGRWHTCSRNCKYYQVPFK